MSINIPRLTSTNSVLIVIDIQDKLLVKIPAAAALVTNTAFLMDAAKLAAVSVIATEQYPKGLGPTTATIRQRIVGDCLSKTAFSCCGANGFLAGLLQLQRPMIVLAGMETHVCMMQTVLDLLEAGLHVVLPVDAVAARFNIDHDTALHRMDRAGAILTTVEAIGFEWLRDSTHPQFKTFSQLIQQRTETP
ncbi:hydrolase [soil metagenome]